MLKSLCFSLAIHLGPRPSLTKPLLCSSNVDCRMWYQRFIEIDAPHKAPIANPKIQLGKRGRKVTPSPSRKWSKQLVIEGANYSAEEHSEVDDEDEDEDKMHEFCRVQVVYKKFLPTSPPPNMRHNYSMTVAHSGSSEHGVLSDATGSFNGDIQPNSPQIYTVSLFS